MIRVQFTVYLQTSSIHDHVHVCYILYIYVYNLSILTPPESLALICLGTCHNNIPLVVGDRSHSQSQIIVQCEQGVRWRNTPSLRSHLRGDLGGVGPPWRYLISSFERTVGGRRAVKHLIKLAYLSHYPGARSAGAALIGPTLTVPPWRQIGQICSKSLCKVR